MNSLDGLVRHVGLGQSEETGGACWMDLLAMLGLPNAAVLDAKLNDAAVMAVLEA